jgi:hypothetical protein
LIPAIIIGAYVSQKGGSVQLTQAALILGGISIVTFLTLIALVIRYKTGIFKDTLEGARNLRGNVPGGDYGITGILGIAVTVIGVALLGYWGQNKNKINNPNNYRNAGIAMLTIGVAIMGVSGGLLYKSRSATGAATTPQTPPGNGNGQQTGTPPAAPGNVTPGASGRIAPPTTPVNSNTE